MKKSELKPGVAVAPQGECEFSLIPNSKLLDLYAAMLKCRAVADRIPNSTPRRRKGPFLISEAVTAGVTIDLLANDAISPAPSDPTPCVLKGVALQTLLRWWSHPAMRLSAHVARAHIIPPAGSAAARLEASLRLAAHFRSASGGSVVVFFVGPDVPLSKSAASPGLSHQLLEPFLHRAAAERLPILLVGQSHQNGEDLLSIAEQSGVPGMAVDRDDVVAIYRVASEALSHARRGNGPTLIVCKPWTVGGRKNQARQVRDPVRKMELYLAGKGLSSKLVKQKFERELAAELGLRIEARARAKRP
ncbi:MAG TPA: thiamine pyrophosphate-dependent enzyme [Terracidiphilus sp.]|nr:thiamine pyrophosphate-dependent enzyme [Terracidiphilus sp.]